MLQNEKCPTGRSRWLTKLYDYFTQHSVYKKCRSVDQSAMGYDKNIKHKCPRSVKLEPVLWIPWVPKFITSRLKLTIPSYEKTALIFSKFCQKGVSYTTKAAVEGLLSFQGGEEKYWARRLGFSQGAQSFAGTWPRKFPRKLVCHQGMRGKIQGKEGSCLLLKTRRDVLPQSVCSTCQSCLPQVLCLPGISKRSVTVL